jgi:hypothetical protein
MILGDINAAVIALHEVPLLFLLLFLLLKLSVRS